jgi:hypothetical protein
MIRNPEEEPVKIRNPKSYSMKTGLNCITLRKSLLLLFFVIYTFSAYSQPDYRFENPTRISGTDGQVGALYRFPSVRTNVDALVRIRAIAGGATLQTIDRTADGFREAFQPEVRVNGRNDGYIEFQITFVRPGTTTDTLSQREVIASALDIDGDRRGVNLLYEYNEINMRGGTYNYNTLSTQLLVLPVVTPSGVAFRATNLTGTLFGAAVDTTALDIMYTVRNANVRSFTWRTGVNNLLSSSQGTRYASLYFKNFIYPNSVLSVPKVLDFKGTSDGNMASLSWTLEVPAESHRTYTCELQRAGDNNTFTTIEEYKEPASKYYSYNGQLLAGGRSLYRLKLTSSDGEVKYSNVLSFYRGNAAIKDLKVYPTVISSNQFTISIPSERKQQGSIQIINYAGQVVYEKQLSLNAGVNSISVSGFNSSLNGNFILVARTGEENYRGKIVIQSNGWAK